MAKFLLRTKRFTVRFLTLWFWFMNNYIYIHGYTLLYPFVPPSIVFFLIPRRILWGFPIFFPKPIFFFETKITYWSRSSHFRFLAKLTRGYWFLFTIKKLQLQLWVRGFIDWRTLSQGVAIWMQRRLFKDPSFMFLDS